MSRVRGEKREEMSGNAGVRGRRRRSTQERRDRSWETAKGREVENAGQDLRAVMAAGYFGAPGLLGGVSLAR